MALPFWFTEMPLMVRYFCFKRKYRLDKHYTVNRGFVKEFLGLLGYIPEGFFHSLDLNQKQRIKMTLRVDNLSQYEDYLDLFIDKLTRNLNDETVDMGFDYPPIQKEVSLDNLLLDRGYRIDMNRFVVDVPKKLYLAADLLEKQTTKQSFYQRKSRTLFIDGVHLMELQLLVYRSFKHTRERGM